MTFAEAMYQAIHGRRFRRASWGNPNCYWKFEYYGRYSFLGGCVFAEDRDATDWELHPEDSLAPYPSKGPNGLTFPAAYSALASGLRIRRKSWPQGVWWECRNCNYAEHPHGWKVGEYITPGDACADDWETLPAVRTVSILSRPYSCTFPAGTMLHGLTFWDMLQALAHGASCHRADNSAWSRTGQRLGWLDYGPALYSKSGLSLGAYTPAVGDVSARDWCAEFFREGKRLKPGFATKNLTFWQAFLHMLNGADATCSIMSSHRLIATWDMPSQSPASYFKGASKPLYNWSNFNRDDIERDIMPRLTSHDWEVLPTPCGVTPSSRDDAIEYALGLLNVAEDSVRSTLSCLGAVKGELHDAKH